jgi:DNA invertase Pin-like site-specific DNA recombinase
MPAAIPYIRFSSARQTTGSSAERQQQMVTHWLTQHSEYTLSDLTYEDLGRSGYNGDHIREGGGFAKLLQAVEAGSIKAGDVVLVEAIDRTGRLSPMRMLRDVISPIIESGVSIITLDDGVTYNRDSVEGGHLFLLVAKIQAAHGYSKALSERTKASYAIRREQAKATGKVKRNTPIWLTSDGKLKEDIAPYVKQAFTLYVSGVGKTTIGNRLRASGVPELATCSGPTVEAWLRNKTAIGYWNDIPNVYEPVVSNELFMQAQQRQSAVATKPRERTSKHFLVGLVKCGVCGSNYVIHHKDGKPNNMRCVLHHRLKSAGCVNAETIPYQVVHKIYMISAHESVGKALQAIQLTENDKRKLALNTERDELTTAIGRLAPLVVSMYSPELEAQLKLATDRRNEIDATLSVLSRAGEHDRNNGRSNDAHYISAVEHDRMLANDDIQLSALLRQAGYAITVNQGHKLTVSGSVAQFTYAGVQRQGNKTVGYRLFEDAHEFIISPIIPELPSKSDDKQSYMMNRSAELVSYKLAVTEIEEETNDDDVYEYE